MIVIGGDITEDAHPRIRNPMVSAVSISSAPSAQAAAGSSVQALRRVAAKQGAPHATSAQAGQSTGCRAGRPADRRVRGSSRVVRQVRGKPFPAPRYSTSGVVAPCAHQHTRGSCTADHLRRRCIAARRLLAHDRAERQSRERENRAAAASYTACSQPGRSRTGSPRSESFRCSRAHGCEHGAAHTHGYAADALRRTASTALARTGDDKLLRIRIRCMRRCYFHRYFRRSFCYCRGGAPFFRSRGRKTSCQATVISIGKFALEAELSAGREHHSALQRRL